MVHYAPEFRLQEPIVSAATTVPIKVTPEAAARLAELGLDAEDERMLEKMREQVPSLRRIGVWVPPGMSLTRRTRSTS